MCWTGPDGTVRTTMTGFLWRRWQPHTLIARDGTGQPVGGNRATHYLTILKDGNIGNDTADGGTDPDNGDWLTN